jgi:hypothetical protein
VLASAGSVRAASLAGRVAIIGVHANDLATMDGAAGRDALI